MLAKDKEEELDLNIEFIEYLASYWNAEAVQKVKNSRARPEDSGFESSRKNELLQ